MPAAAARAVLREDPGAGGHGVQGQLRTCSEHRAARARHSSRTAQTLGAGVSSQGPCAARSSSRARDAAFTVHSSWTDPGLRALLAAPASPQPGLRRHLLAGRLLRASGARGRAPGPSQGPARGRVAGADRARGCAVRLGPGGFRPRLAPVPPSRARGVRGVARPGAEAQRPQLTAAKGGQVERKVLGPR